MIAKYNLLRHHPCFDYFTWLINVKMRGATEIVIQNQTISNMLKDEWGVEDVQNRVQSILEPGPKFLGLPPAETGLEGEDICNSSFREFIEELAPNYNFPRLDSTFVPYKPSKYTITIRNSWQEPWRNSHPRVWRNFARAIGAEVIEDYYTHPLSLEQRMARYAFAEMNFFVPSGPAHMMFYTNFPYVVFNCGSRTFAKTSIKYGVPRLPWANSNQHLIWEPATEASLGKFCQQWL